MYGQNFLCACTECYGNTDLILIQEYLAHPSGCGFIQIYTCIAKHY